MSSLSSIFGKNKKVATNDTGDHWLSVSDLMAGLMIVFLFISIVLMRNALIERDQIKEIAATYQDNKINIYNALMKEFEADLVRWDAEIKKKDLTFNFKSPEVLFSVGKIKLKPKFKTILNDFSPRYFSVIAQFRGSIEEIRIEGHTSSKWGRSSNDDAYFNNMGLSQGRTRSVLSYIYQLNSMMKEREWIKGNVAAVGYSSAKLIIQNGVEDSRRSRRVTFRLITNSETQILKIMGE